MRPSQKRKIQRAQALAADWKKIVEATESITEELESAAGEVTEDAVNTLTEYTNRHPKHALLAAVLVGFSIGYWIKRK